MKVGFGVLSPTERAPTADRPSVERGAALHSDQLSSHMCSVPSPSRLRVPPGSDGGNLALARNRAGHSGDTHTIVPISDSLVPSGLRALDS